MMTIIKFLCPSEGILIGFHVLSFWYVEELCSSQDKPTKVEDGNVHLNCKLWILNFHTFVLSNGDLMCHKNPKIQFMRKQPCLFTKSMS